MVIPAQGWWKGRHFIDGGWKIDVATPAQWTGDRCVLDDLDLDVLRQRGEVWVEDEDEFDSRVAAGVYPPDLERAAVAETWRLAEALAAHHPPFDVTGDRWLRLSVTPPRAGRAIFFDMGGVLLEPLPSATAFEAEWLPRIRDAIDGGWEAGLTEADMVRRLADAAGLSPRQAREVFAESHRHARLQPELVGMFYGLRSAGVGLGVVSNNGPGVSKHWDSVHLLSQKVDVVVVSGEEQVAKPDSRIFEIAACRIGLLPSACTMVDDDARNVEGAIAAGMKGLVHESVKETVRALYRR